MRSEFSVIIPDEKKGYLNTVYELKVNIGNEVFTQRLTVDEYPTENNPPSSFIKSRLVENILHHIETEIMKDVGRF